MTKYLAKDYHGEPFHLFGAAHLISLVIIVAAISCLLLLRNDLSDRFRNLFRFSLATILMTNEASYHLWNLLTQQWTIQKMLPLHICSVMVWVSAIMLISKSYGLYEFVYFLGIGGAMATLLTPDAGPYGFPHIRFWQIFISHGAFLIAAVYMTVIEKYRPTWRSVVKVLLFGNVYLIVVYFANCLINSNYMFTVHKPDTASILDYMGPWPWYIVGAEIIGLLVIVVLYSPFAIADWKVDTI